MNESQKPMTVVEVDDLLKSTLHGPPPQATIYRMMATLAEWKGDRKKLERIQKYLDSFIKWRNEDQVVTVTEDNTIRSSPEFPRKAGEALFKINKELRQ